MHSLKQEPFPELIKRKDFYAWVILDKPFDPILHDKVLMRRYENCSHNQKIF